MKKVVLHLIVVCFVCFAEYGNSQTTVWEENFDYSNGTTQGSGTPPKWTINTLPNADRWEVRSDIMEAKDLDGIGIWTSENITISSISEVAISVDLSESGGMDATDYIGVYYVLDGGTETEFDINGFLADDFTSATAYQSGLSGNSLAIVIRIFNNANNEAHMFDNVRVFKSLEGDFCADAIAIGEVTDLPFSTLAASQSGENPGCGGNQNPYDIWYSYTATASGLGLFDLCGSEFDTRIAIWDACGGSVLACNEKDGPVCDGQQSSIELLVAAGVTYYVQVGGDKENQGNGDLTIQVLPVPPSNDDCANAIPINEVSDLPFSTLAASQSGINPGCGGNQDPFDVWYAYTATSSGLGLFDLCGSEFDTRIAIWDACGGSVLACNEKDGPVCDGQQSSIDLLVTAGVTYYVQVGGDKENQGNGDLTIQVLPVPPSNDDCANAVPINEVSSLPFSTLGASQSGDNPGCGGNQDPFDIWYAYTATSSGLGLFDLCGSEFDTRIAIWDACGGSVLACNEKDGPVCDGQQSSIDLLVTAGVTYYVQVGGDKENQGNGVLTIQVIPESPSNDDCANAIPINEVTDLPFNTLTASQSGENPGCGGNQDPFDLWYAYTASGTGFATFDLCGSELDTRLSIWDACGGNVLACNEKNGPACSGEQSSIELEVIAGVTYYVQVGGDKENQGNGDLTISLIAYPANDICSSATPIIEVTDLAFNTTLATKSGVNPGCGGDDPVDIWFAYTSTYSGTALFDLCGSNFDTRLAIWDACGGSVLACNDDNGPVCTGTNASIEMDVIAGTTYYLQVGGFDAIAGGGDLTISFDESIWTGAVSSDWNTPGNWSSGSIPDETVSVIIPGGAPNYPVITNDLFIRVNYGTNSCKSLAILDGGSLTLIYWGSITIFGDVWVESGGALNTNRIKLGYGGRLWISGGTVTANNEFLLESGGGNMSSGNIYTSGLIEFKNNTGWTATGGDIHLIGGNASTFISSSAVSFIHNLIIDPDADVIYNGNITVGGDLTIQPGGGLNLNSGTINVAGNTYFKADATGMAAFIDNGTLNVAGSSSVEQYLTSEMWHLVSAPLSDAQIVHYEDIYLREYNEPTDTWTYLVEPVTQPMNVTQGYSAWSSDALLGNTTVTFNGSLNPGTDFPITSLSYTPASPNMGWNVLGNPYPAPLQWNNTWTKTDLSDWACIWSNGSSQCYNAATGTGWPNPGDMPDGIIPTTQGFWVRATSASASVTIPASQRTFSDQAFYKSGLVSVNESIRLRIDGGDHSDIVVVQFIPDASAGYDPEYDLEKRWDSNNPIQTYALAAENEAFSVHVLPLFDKDLIIPIGLEVDNGGTYTFTPTELENMNFGTQLVLEDLKENTLTFLDLDQSYEFTASPEDDAHRFNLVFDGGLTGMDEDQPREAEIYSYGNSVYVRAAGGIPYDVVIFDLMGREISRKEKNRDPLTKLEVTNGTGYYVVKVRSNQSISTQKVFIR